MNASYFRTQVFVPSRGFLFFYKMKKTMIILASVVFVPSRGFLFFYAKKSCNSLESWVFVPSRGFLFFYRIGRILEEMVWGFRPLTGISLFLWLFFQFLEISFVLVFVPSRGFLFFYSWLNTYQNCLNKMFSSPHGDFSFSILSHIPLINQGLFL